MTDIDVPDWAVDQFATILFDTQGLDWPEDFPECADDVRAQIRAALSAWVVPKPIDWQPSGRKRVFIPDAPVVQIGAPLAMTGRWETSYYWRAEMGGKTTNGSPPTEALYTLRQEKPE